MANPAKVSIIGLVRARMATMLSARSRTSSIDSAIRLPIIASRLNALMMRMPRAVCCISEMTDAQRGELGARDRAHPPDQLDDEVDHDRSAEQDDQRHQRALDEHDR